MSSSSGARWSWPRKARRWPRPIRWSGPSSWTSAGASSAVALTLTPEWKHAEVLAIEQAGALARGNTLYLNLEPCSHTGRTGPCADAVIAAGIARVVCCMEDPNPLVAGKGFAKLRAAGIEVEVGGLQTEARRLNESFARYIRTGLPFVTLKSAMSLDGKIAGPQQGNKGLAGGPASKASKSSTTYITGEASRRRVHEMRHASDAILVGIGTILADDPLLTDRSGLPRRRPLLRVVLDSQLRLPLSSRLVESAKEDVLVFCSVADESKRRDLEARGVRICQIERAGSGQRRSSCPRPTCIHRRYLPRSEQSRSPACWWRAARRSTGLFCAKALVDKLTLFFAPTIFGPGSVPWLAGEGTAATRPLDAFNLRVERFGEDFAVECLPARSLRFEGDANP